MVVKASVSFLAKDSDSVLAARVTTVVTSVKGNPNYLEPDPTLPVSTAATDAFKAAISGAADGGKQLNWTKRVRRTELVGIVRQFCAYLQMACGGDMTKLLSSGIPVQNPNRDKAEVPATPVAPIVSQGLTGQAKLATTPVAYAFVYNWQVALADAPETILMRGQSTSAKVALAGLTPGKPYLVQVNAVGTAGASDWSNAGSRIII